MEKNNGKPHTHSEVADIPSPDLQFARASHVAQSNVNKPKKNYLMWGVVSDR